MPDRVRKEKGANYLLQPEKFKSFPADSHSDCQKEKTSW